MSRNKTYGDSCGVARALDAVGERWALLVIRDLLLGPKRYTDLQAGLPGISPNVLSARLRELSDAGVITRRRLPPPVSGQVYELTTWGRELEPVLLNLGVWGSKSPAAPPTTPLSMDSLILSIRTVLTPAPTPSTAATVQLEVDDDIFAITVHPQEIHIRRGEAHAPDAVLTTSATTLEDMFLGQRTLGDALQHGDATLTGDPAAAKRLLPASPT